MFGALPVAAIDTGLVMKVLEPIWTKKPETAPRARPHRVGARLGQVRGYREGENPARWRGHLDQLLPAKQGREGRAPAALPYAEVGAFMAALREQPGHHARALEFSILTAARTGEVSARPGTRSTSTRRLWTVPAARMKAGKEHRVPLSAPRSPC